jgi:hypothetical protein
MNNPGGQSRGVPLIADPPGSVRPRLRRLLDSDIVAIAAAFGVAILVTAFADPSIVRRPPTVELHLTNSTDYRIAVRASDEHGHDWVPLGSVPPGRDLVLGSVFDQGDTWTFQFRGQGREGGELQLDRLTLAEADWNVEIPEYVADHLRDQGAPAHSDP